MWVWVGGGGGIPSDYLVSTQIQLWLSCCWSRGCCWAVTIVSDKERSPQILSNQKLSCPLHETIDIASAIGEVTNITCISSKQMTSF